MPYNKVEGIDRSPAPVRLATFTGNKQPPEDGMLFLNIGNPAHRDALRTLSSLPRQELKRGRHIIVPSVDGQDGIALVIEETEESNGRLVIFRGDINSFEFRRDIGGVVENVVFGRRARGDVKDDELIIEKIVMFRRKRLRLEDYPPIWTPSDSTPSNGDIVERERRVALLTS